MAIIFDDTEYAVIRSLGDGHCLIYSFESSWTHQLNTLSPQYNDILTKIENEVTINWSLYEPFVGSNANLQSSLQKYIVQKIYDQDFGDVVSYVLANAFAINIIILDELQDGTIDKVDVFPESRSSDHCFAISIAWQLLALN